jgi:hypothetical protein
MDASDARPGTDRSRPRRLPMVLVVVATIVGIASVFALWGNRQLLESETWSQTSEELVEDEDVQEALAAFITTTLYENVDVQQLLTDRLPPELAPLAGPASGALRNVTEDVALRALEQPKVQQLWVDANGVAHAKLVQLIEDRGEFVSTGGGVVTVDLQGILAEVTTQLGVGEKLVSKLPPEAAAFEVMRSDELESAQRAVHALHTAAWVLTVLTLLLFAAAVALAGERRREILRATGVGFVVIGAVVLLARQFAADAVVGSLSEAAANDAAVAATFSIGTSLLLETGQSIVGYGLVMILAAWFAGPTAWATSARRGITPYLRRPGYAYGGTAVLLVLLFWWDPVVATHRLLPSLVLVLLALIGTEMLRRQVIREFPDHVTPRSAAGIAHGLAARMSAARQSRVTSPESATPAMSPAAAAGADRISALERLGGLRASGVLSEAEFEAEKARLLSV